MPEQYDAAASLPRINGAPIVGVRPGSPLLYQVAAVGTGPLHFRAERLPDGLKIDPVSGMITGQVEARGRYTTRLTVHDHNGEAARDLIIAVGDRLCLTPPMGWNSWYAYSEEVSEAAVRATAAAMVERGLTAHGWSYLCIDDCWQGERGGPDNALQPNERFPDIARLCRDLHAAGLKIGLYSTPWMGSYAGFLGGSADNASGLPPSAALPPEQRLQRGQLFGRYPGTHDRGMDRVGPHWLFAADVRQWDDWGIDFVKVDWHPNDVATTARIAADLGRACRDIVLSLSNNAPLENAAGLSQLAHLWRTTGDVTDSWESLVSIAMAQRDWLPYMSPGHWNDPDMLQIGPLGIPNSTGSGFRLTRLNADEQMFQMSLWCLLSAPLFLSCDVAVLSPFTLALLTNDDVIAIDQDPLGAAPRLERRGETDIWRKDLADGSVCVGLLNRADAPTTVAIDWTSLGIPEDAPVQNLWERRGIGQAAALTTLLVPAHGAILLRVSSPNLCF